MLIELRVSMQWAEMKRHHSLVALCLLEEMMFAIRS